MILICYFYLLFSTFVKAFPGWRCSEIRPEVFLCKKPCTGLSSIGPFPKHQKISNHWSDEPFAHKPISEIKARADHAVDKIQVKYGNVWANEHGGNKGFFKGCKFTSKIIKVILRISGNYEGFLHGIEFVPADGPHCILGDMKFREGILPGPGRTIIVQSKNSYLSHISG